MFNPNEVCSWCMCPLDGAAVLMFHSLRSVCPVVWNHGLSTCRPSRPVMIKCRAVVWVTGVSERLFIGFRQPDIHESDSVKTSEVWRPTNGRTAV